MSTELQRFHAVPVERVEIDGITMAVRRFGQGPALLMIHGWPLSGSTYRGLIARLSPHFTCIVPDLPGAGDSPFDPPIGELFTGGAKLVGALVDALGLREYALLGHDSGGGIARLLAADQGTRVRALVLTNTEVTGHVPGLMSFYKAAAALPGSTAVFTRLLRAAWYRRSRFGFGDCFEDRRFVDGEFALTLAKDMRGATAQLRCADIRIAQRLAEIHAAIHAPTLCVWGADDPLFPLPKARAMLSEFAGPTRLEVLAGGRVFVHEEQPERIAGYALPFLQHAFSEQRAESLLQ